MTTLYLPWFKIILCSFIIKSNPTTVVIATDTIIALETAFCSKVHYFIHKKFSA